MPESLWNRCLRVLEGELPEQQFNTWVRPLQAVEREGELKLLAPNRYVIEWLGQNLLPRIKELILAFAEGLAPEVALDVGTRAGVIVQVPPAAMRARKPWVRARCKLLGLKVRFIAQLEQKPRAKSMNWEIYERRQGY